MQCAQGRMDGGVTRMHKPERDPERDGSTGIAELGESSVAADSPPEMTPWWRVPSRAGVAPRLVRWSKILSAYFTAQVSTRLAGIAAGLILVNLMPVGEYALYTLAMSVLTFLAFVTDLGATSSLLYFNRETRRDGEPLAPYADAVMSLRRGVFAVGAPVVLVIFVAVALRRGFDTRSAVLAGASIVVAVWFQMVSAVRVLVLRLADRYTRSYVAEGAGEATRLFGAGVMAFTGALSGWLGVAVSAAGSVIGAAAAGADAHPQERRRVLPGPFRRQIVRYLLPTLPSAAYFAVQGPLVVWLAATFGGTRNIAEVGALGRLGLIVGIFSSLTSIVFLPRLSVVTDEPLYLRRFLQFGAFLALLGVGLVAVAVVFPKALLLLIGPNYAGLHTALVIVVSSAAVNLLGSYLVAVNMARSWTRWQAVATGFMVCAQAVGAALLPLSTTVGILSFGLVTSGAGTFAQSLICGIGFRRSHLVGWRIR
jgi:O-antigen/teichoic acid export membrane protein